jgi:hypothetical protein
VAALNWNPMSFMGNTNQPFEKPEAPAGMAISGHAPASPLRQRASKFLEGMFDKGFQKTGSLSKSLTPVDVGTKVGVW